VSKTDWKDVSARIERSYLAVAPKRLLTKRKA
jgi:hypothetical protein